MKKLILILIVLLLATDVRAEDKFDRITIHDIYFNIPGKWEQKSEDTVKNRWYFQEKDYGLSMTITVRKADTFAFYKPGIYDLELIKAHYEWETKIFPKVSIAEFRILETDTSSHYIIWRLIQNTSRELILSCIRKGKLVDVAINTKLGEIRITDNVAAAFLEAVKIEEE